MKFYRKAGLLLMLVFAGISCKKSPNCTIPNVLVDFTVYTSDPAFVKLNAIGGWVYVTGGSKGIIIYHQGVDQFMAYDRNCTYNPTSATAIINVDTTNNITATDPSCGSKFSIYDGSVTQGPASCALKQYSASLSGTALHVSSQ